MWELDHCFSSHHHYCVKFRKMEWNVSFHHPTTNRVWMDLFYKHMAKEVFTWSHFSSLVTAGALMNLPDAPSLSIWKVMCSNLLFFPFFLSPVPTFQRICSAPIWCNIHIGSKYQNKVKLLLFPAVLLGCWTRRRGEVKLSGSDDGMVMWEIHLGGRGSESFPSRLSLSSAKKDLHATDAALFPRQTTQILE